MFRTMINMGLQKKGVQGEYKNTHSVKPIWVIGLNLLYAQMFDALASALSLWI